MTKRYILLSILLLLLFTLDSSAQKKRTAKANEAFNAGEFYEAIDLYKDAYSVIQDKVEKTAVSFMVAECYRKTRTLAEIIRIPSHSFVMPMPKR